MTEAGIDERPRTPTDEELPALLEELEAAGGSVSAFARDRGLTPWKLYEARQGRRGGSKRKRRNPRRRDLVPVRVVDRVELAAPPLELMLSSGHRLVIPPEFDERALRRLMGVLASC